MKFPTPFPPTMQARERPLKGYAPWRLHSGFAPGISSALLETSTSLVATRPGYAHRSFLHFEILSRHSRQSTGVSHE